MQYDKSILLQGNKQTTQPYKNVTNDSKAYGINCPSLNHYYL